jgi:hypothetical protein
MDRANAWLNLIANIGVIAGIVFVGLELRQNSNAVRSQTRSQISIAYAELLQTQMLDNEFQEARIQAQGGEPMAPLGQSKMRFNILAHLRLAENSFYQFREGNYSESEFDGERNFWRAFIARPQFREIWEDVKSDFSPDFRQEMEALIE